jgi:hypothetical protein
MAISVTILVTNKKNDTYIMYLPQSMGLTLNKVRKCYFSGTVYAVPVLSTEYIHLVYIFFFVKL